MTQLYRHFDEEDNLLYVGVSLSALHRLGQHRHHSQWFETIKKVTIETFPTREEALEAERRSIRVEKPLHNVRHQVKEIRPRSSRVQDSVDALTWNIVNFQPTYSVVEVSTILGCSVHSIKTLTETGEMGHIKFKYGKDRTRIRITGWQFLEYIEHLENIPKRCK